MTAFSEGPFLINEIDPAFEDAPVVGCGLDFPDFEDFFGELAVTFFFMATRPPQVEQLIRVR